MPVRAYESTGRNAGNRHRARDPWIETLAWLMDSSIPLGRWSIGLDGLFGLVPGFGDLAGTFVSLVIISRAAAAGVPRPAIARMVVNVAIDTLLGAIPLIGDLFDFAYKSNLKNLRIYEETVYHGRSTVRDWLFFGLLAAGALALAAIPVAALVLLLRAV